MFAVISELMYMSSHMFLYFCIYDLICLLVQIPVIVFSKKRFARLLPSIIFVLLIPAVLFFAGLAMMSGPGGWLAFVALGAALHALIPTGIAWLIYGILLIDRENQKKQNTERDAE